MYCTNEKLKESWSYARKGNLATILYSSLGKHRYVFLLFRLELKIYLNSNHNEKYLFRAFVKIRKKYAFCHKLFRFLFHFMCKFWTDTNIVKK